MRRTDPSTETQVDLFLQSESEFETSLEFHDIGLDLIILGIPFFRKFAVSFAPKLEAMFVHRAAGR